ncbi:MAG: hypothetical protein E6H54_01165 [Betaproteobacteria bacterium]|nr:MAG: hypothetical protein E6H54_01165 [Betaproteobacteria bacterium]
MLAFRADHIGSLLRPKALREAFRKHAGGELAERELCAQGHESDFTGPYVCANVARSVPITVDEFRFVKQHTARAASMSRGVRTKLPMCSA